MSATQRKAELCGTEVTPCGACRAEDFKTNLRSALINSFEPGL